MASWLKREPEAELEAKPIEIKPEIIREALKDDLAEMKTSSAAMMEYIKQQKEEREAALAAEAEKERKAAVARETPDEIDFTLDPEGAINKKLRPIAESNALMASMFMRREILNNDAFEYYADSEFKAAVDKIIDSQPIQYRTNAEIIKNAYKVTKYDFDDKIKEGKVKSSLSIGGGNSPSTLPPEQAALETMTVVEKEYARKMGISEKDWLKQKKELEYV